MSFIPLVSLACLVVALYAVFFKLAALILKRTRLAWGHSFGFAAILTFVAFGIRAVAAASGAGSVVSAAGIAVGLLLGGWYFGTYAKRADGRALGWAGGFVLTLIGMALLIAFGVATVGVTHLFLRP